MRHYSVMIRTVHQNKWKLSLQHCTSAEFSSLHTLSCTCVIISSQAHREVLFWWPIPKMLSVWHCRCLGEPAVIGRDRLWTGLVRRFTLCILEAMLDPMARARTLSWNQRGPNGAPSSTSSTTSTADHLHRRGRHSRPPEPTTRLCG